MPYRCREKGCAKRFSAKIGTVMEGSKLGFQVWMIAMYLLSTSLKSVSSMKLHHDLSINQRSAWFLAHRLRKALAEDGDVFDGPVEVDETYFGGKRRNMSNTERRELAKEGAGRGAVGKTAVMSTTASAEAFDDGHDLVTALDPENQTLHFGATIFIAGVFESWKALSAIAGETSPFCGTENLTRKDVADLVRVWLRSGSDETLNGDPVIGTLLAFHGQFSCD